MQKIKFRVFSFLLCLVFCFNLFFDNCFALVGVDDAAIIAGAAGSAALAPALGAAGLDYIIHKLIEEYVADSDADDSQIDLLAEGFRAYLETEGIMNFLSDPVNYAQYWAAYQVKDAVTGVVQNRLRLSFDSNMYKLLFNALSAYVSSKAVDGAISFADVDSAASEYVVANNISDVISVIAPFYQAYFDTDKSPHVRNLNEPCYISCFSDGDNNSRFQILYCRNGFFDEASEIGCDCISPRNYTYTGWSVNHNLYVNIYFDPSAVSSPLDSTDVPVNSDFADTCADDSRAFGDTYNTTYNVYNPSGVVTQTEGIAADIPLETAVDGSIVYDDDGVPVVAAPTVGLMPWVLDDPEAIARVGSMADTVPDTLTGDDAVDQATVWGSITSFIRNFWENLLKTIMSGVRAVLLGIFVPSKSDILDCFNFLKMQFVNVFGFEPFDLSTIFGEGRAPENLYMDFDFLGLALYHVKVVDMDVLAHVVSIFRGLIRGLIVLWLILYNINQFFALIGAGDLALGSVREFQAAQADVPAGRVRGDLIRAKMGKVE